MTRTTQQPAGDSRIIAQDLDHLADRFDDIASRSENNGFASAAEGASIIRLFDLLSRGGRLITVAYLNGFLPKNPVIEKRVKFHLGETEESEPKGIPTPSMANLFLEIMGGAVTSVRKKSITAGFDPSEGALHAQYPGFVPPIWGYIERAIAEPSKKAKRAIMHMGTVETHHNHARGCRLLAETVRRSGISELGEGAATGSEVYDTIDYDILVVLREQEVKRGGGTMIIAEIVAATGHCQQAVNAAILRLTEGGLVARPKGTERKGFGLTERGRQLLNRVGSNEPAGR